MLGLIVEQVTGRRYADLLRERITGPLGLRETRQPAGSDLPEPFSRGYTTQGLPDGEPFSDGYPARGLPEGWPGFQDATSWHPSWAWAVGDLISTMGDLRVWARAVGSGVLLSPRMQAERLTRVTIAPNTPDRAYALGIGYFGGWWGHSGELPGYNSFALYHPDFDAVLVVIANADELPYRGETAPPAVVVANAIIEIMQRELPPGPRQAPVQLP